MWGKRRNRSWANYNPLLIGKAVGKSYNQDNFQSIYKHWQWISDNITAVALLLKMSKSTATWLQPSEAEQISDSPTFADNSWAEVPHSRGHTPERQLASSSLPPVTHPRGFSSLFGFPKPCCTIVNSSFFTVFSITLCSLSPSVKPTDTLRYTMS